MFQKFPAFLETDWKNTMCDTATVLEHLSTEEKRMYTLMCRGPRYTEQQARFITNNRFKTNISLLNIAAKYLK